MLEAIAGAVQWASNAVWGPWTIVLLFGTGIFLTLRFRFVQVRRLGEAVRGMRSGGSDDPEATGSGGEGAGVLSTLQAFMTGLAGSVGTGNIAGVATAIVTGGPGAVFWLWCYGFFATAIKLTEAILAVHFRKEGAGPFSAGPMQYLEHGIGSRKLALTYALIAGVAALTTTPFTQSNSIAVVFESQLGVEPLVTGIVLAIFAWMVVIGGVQTIGRVAERLAPAMVLLYLVGGLVVIGSFASEIPEVLALILREAFSGEAAAGGAAGGGMMVAVRYGLARGIYANEAGYGTAAVAYGSAKGAQPVRQGLNAMVEVYIVSFVTSSISALTILVSGVWQSGTTSTAVVAEAFDVAIPFGGEVVLLSALLFGYTTIIGWGYYGEQFLQYLAGERIVLPYRWVYCILIVFGATTGVDLVWAWGDLMNGLQIFPNLIGVLGLSGVAATLLKRGDTVSSVGESS